MGSRVVQTGPAGTLPQAYVAALNGLNLSGQTLAGTGSETHVNRYDANGRIVRQDVYKSDNAPKYSVIYDVLPAGQVPNIGTAGGYDTAGNLLGYTVVDWTSLVSTNYANTYQRAEGYLQASSIATSSNGSIGGTYWSYGHDGALIDVVDATKPTENRHFVTDMAGTVLYAEQNGQAQRQVVVNGEVLGRYGQIRDEANPSTPGANGVPIFHTEAQFNFGYQPVDGNYPSASPGTYAVSAGDTLQSIARGAYGDEGLWYVIADANGIASNADLKPGTVLTIPAKVGSANNANSFKPYDPTKVVGDTSPNLAQPQGQGGEACGGFGQIIVIAIAVIATVYTAGLLSGASGSLVSTLGTGASTLGGTTVAGTASATLGSFGTGLVAGAAGSVVSQGVGIAIGAQDEFSWKGVALSALSTGVSAGVAGALNVPNGLLSGNGFGAVAGRAAISNALTQGVAVATGLQDKFSWRGVAASAAGAGVGSAVMSGVNGAMGYDPQSQFDFGKNLVSGTAAGLAAGLTANVLSGGRVSVTQVATDAFGNALGDSIAVANGQGSGEDELDALFRANNNWAAVSASPTFAEDTAMRQASMNPYGLRTSSAAQLIGERGWAPTSGFGYGGAVNGITGAVANASASSGSQQEISASTADALLTGLGLRPNWAAPGILVADAWARDPSQNTVVSDAGSLTLPRAWNMRDASAAVIAATQQARFENGPQMTASNSQSAADLERTRSNLGMAIAAPVVGAGLGVAVYAGANTFVAAQLAKAPALELGYSQLATGMATSGVFSAATYTLLNGGESTPEGLAIAFTAGAVGGGVVKQGLNFAAQLPNTAIPFTLSNSVTQGTGTAVGFATFGLRNTFGVNGEGQSWWTRPFYSPSSPSNDKR